MSWTEEASKQTEAENDEWMCQGCIAHNRYCDRFWFSPYQWMLGITPRIFRSLTNVETLETREVAQRPALDDIRAHDCRVAATTAFFKLDANNMIARASAARLVDGYRPTPGDQVMVHR